MSFRTLPGPSDSNSYWSFFKLNQWNIDLQEILGFFFFFWCLCKCYCLFWRTINSLYYLSQKVMGRCEKSFVNYKIHYWSLCHSLQLITVFELGPNVWFVKWPHMATIVLRACSPLCCWLAQKWVQSVTSNVGKFPLKICHFKH